MTWHTERATSAATGRRTSRSSTRRSSPCRRSLKAFLKWLPHYFLPWNLLFALSAVAYWAWIIPPVETMQTLSWGWPLWLYAVNAVAIFLFYGAFELHLYVLKRQERRFKYNGKFPSEQKSKAFWFESQNIDNILRTFLSGVTIWTAVEVLVLWAFANGYAPWLSFADHPVYLAALALVVPIIHEFHFFCIHRLIHTPFLYKWVHSVHHNSVNPSPWSSLSMHPVEHLLYFGDRLLPPDHPVEPDHRALPAALRRLRRDPRPCRLRQDRGGRERLRR